MMDYTSLYNFMDNTRLADWRDLLKRQIDEALDESSNGDLAKWNAILKSLPCSKPTHIDLDQGAILIGEPDDTTREKRKFIEQTMKQFHPWRKGPYSLFGIHIDTEWRSDWKWDRVKDHITPLEDRVVLDVGSGNGYHGWRMLGAGAKLVIGIDPFLLSVVQYHAIKHFIGDEPMYVVPVGVEKMPENLKVFDTVFSMGVMYHRRSPIDHLYELKSFLRPGGELVLETLVIDGGPEKVLVPEDRYAQMRNVWFVPSCLTLESWLKRCGFNDVRCVNITKTTFGEQRSTDWMQWDSLANFLDPENPNLTIEGYPAPVRAVFIANVG